LAKELNIPILVLHQFGRGGESGRPQLSDIREYDAIEQNADIVIFLHRPNYRRSYESDQEKIEVIIAKNHNGATGTIQMDYKVALSRIDN
jgi:replicative DNA helicase